MAELTSDYFENLLAGLRANLGDASNSLSSCLGQNIALEVDDSGPWIGEVPIPGGDEPGLLIAFRLGNQGIVVAIPESLPLPDWYASPNDSESARLQTLAMEWSLNLLPADVAVNEFTTIEVANLRQGVDESHPYKEAQFVVLRATRDDSDTAGKICLIGPVAVPPVASVKPQRRAATESVGSLPRLASAAPQPMTSPPARVSPPAHAGRKRQSPLLGLPVQVVVMLAEKKIELGQLLSLSPGSLVQFDKSCDSLLDLYVNNQLYCRGEAIKIGENFGLKVNEVRPQPTRAKKVL